MNHYQQKRWSFKKNLTFINFITKGKRTLIKRV